MNLKQPARWLAAAILANALMTGGSNGQDRLTQSAAAQAQTTGTTVLSLEGNDWVVAADPKNAGRDEAWWKGREAGRQAGPRAGHLAGGAAGLSRRGVVLARVHRPRRSPIAGGRCLLRFHAVDYLAQVWVNDMPVGGHEGGETPFTLDITDAVKPGATNRLAVRVLNPKAEPIDGIVLAETPHRNKVPAGIGVGGSYNSGGITEPVEVFWTPAVRIDDVYVRPDWKTGEVQVQVTRDATRARPPCPASSSSSSLPALGNEPVARADAGAGHAARQQPGRVRVDRGNHRLWQLDDPYLYRLTTRVDRRRATRTAHENVTRFGFRELRVEKGYFRLNGKRIFLKSSHTGNHCPVGAILPPASAPDLLRKDLLYMKSCGFNTVRFIAGIAHPYQLDLCDEIGLMVYEENLASWLLADSPKMAERFDANLREMVLRDRNHPSVVIFGLVNEMGNGPMVAARGGQPGPAAVAGRFAAGAAAERAVGRPVQHRVGLQPRRHAVGIRVGRRESRLPGHGQERPVGRLFRRRGRCACLSRHAAHAGHRGGHPQPGQGHASRSFSPNTASAA